MCSGVLVCSGISTNHASTNRIVAVAATFPLIFPLYKSKFLKSKYFMLFEHGSVFLSVVSLSAENKMATIFGLVDRARSNRNSSPNSRNQDSDVHV